MESSDFIIKIAQQLKNTNLDQLSPNTNFWELEEWSSLTALSVVYMIDEEYGVTLRSADIKGVKTIQDLFEVVVSKKQ